MRRELVIGWAACAAMFAACTQDYDTFDASGGAGVGGVDASSGDAKTDGAAGLGYGGFSGAAGGTTGGAAGTPKGGAAGTAQGGAAGTAQGGAAGTPQGGAAGEVQGGAAGEAQGGAAGTVADASTEEAAACNAGLKPCNGICVKDDDPAYGCAQPDCTPCTLEHATAQCVNGACAVLACTTGFSDCDSDGSNGCESATSNDTGNCGGCTRACDQTQVQNLVCNAGLCTSTCQNGFANCSRPAAPAADDGCESAIATDTSNCGACDRACSNEHVAQLTCSLSRCMSTCEAGWGNCTQPQAPTADNGCETDLQTSAANCGACGNNCGLLDNKVCVAGACACSDSSQCSVGGATGSCNTTSGLCSCGSPGSECRPGEWCRKAGNNHLCTCFNDTACTATQVCCAATGKCEASCP